MTSLVLLGGDIDPAADDVHRWGMPLLGGAPLSGGVEHWHHHDNEHDHEDPPPPFHVATSQDFPRTHTETGAARGRRGSGVGMEDKLDLEQLKSSLSEFEQFQKVDAARQRRESHLKQKVCQASLRNTNSAQKSFQVFQQQWVEDNAHDEYAGLLRRKQNEHVMLRRVQKGILKHMHDGQLDQSMEARERIQQIKKEARWHFQSLQNLFDDRVKTLRGQEMDLRMSQDQDVGNYKRVHDQLRQFNVLKQKKMLQDNKQMLQQKRLYSAQMRQDTHQQLLSYLATGEAWEDSLRASWPPASTSSAAMDFRTSMKPSSKPAIVKGGKPQRHHHSVYSPKAKTHFNKKKTVTRPKSAPLHQQHR